MITKPLTKMRLLVDLDAEASVGGKEHLRELCELWGLKPYRRAKGFAFYAVDEIEAAQKRREEPSEL